MSKIMMTMNIKTLCVLGCVLSGMSVFDAAAGEHTSVYPNLNASPLSNTNITVPSNSEPKKDAVTEQKVDAADAYVCVPRKCIPCWVYALMPSSVTARESVQQRSFPEKAAGLMIKKAALKSGVSEKNGSAAESPSVSVEALEFHTSPGMRQIYSWTRWGLVNKYPAYVAGGSCVSAYLMAWSLPLVGKFISPFLKPFAMLSLITGVVLHVPSIVEKLKNMPQALEASYTLKFNESVVCQRVAAIKEPTFFQRLSPWQYAQLTKRAK